MHAAQREWIETAFSRLEEIEVQRSRLDAEYRRLFEAIEALADAGVSPDTVDPRLPSASLAATPVEWEDFSSTAWAYDSESVVAANPAPAAPVEAVEPSPRMRRSSKRGGRASLALAVGAGLVLGAFGYVRWVASGSQRLGPGPATTDAHGEPAPVVDPRR